MCRDDIVSGSTRIKKRWRAIARSVVAVTSHYSSEEVCASSYATRAGETQPCDGGRHLWIKRTCAWNTW
jgi:hypothetical protein